MKSDNQLDIPNEHLITDIKSIIENGRRNAYESVNRIAVLTYWNIGKKIMVQDLLQGI